MGQFSSLVQISTLTCILRIWGLIQAIGSYEKIYELIFMLEN